MPAESSRAVFLSYASQDAEAVRGICDALRAAGIEVWFDRSELRGGELWDQKIRRQIKECALFVPIISANTQARREGYFRIEWKLAAQRIHAMADGTPFVVPLVIDATRDLDALLPDEFRAVQWLRLPAGETTRALCARVKTLLGDDTSPEEVGTSADQRSLDSATPAPRHLGNLTAMRGDLACSDCRWQRSNCSRGALAPMGADATARSNHNAFPTGRLAVGRVAVNDDWYNGR